MKATEYMLTGRLNMGKMVCGKCGLMLPFEKIRWDEVHKCFICGDCRQL
jgi:hypothetical protein